MSFTLTDEERDAVIDALQSSDDARVNQVIEAAATRAADDRYAFRAATDAFKRENPDLAEDPAMWALMQNVDAELAAKRPDLTYAQRLRKGAWLVRSHYDPALDEEAGRREGIRQIFKNRHKVELEDVGSDGEETDWQRVDREHEEDTSTAVAEMKAQRIRQRENIAAQDRARLRGGWEE